MKNCNRSDFVITGLGITSAIGQGKKNFLAALMNGCNYFDFMKRPGRQNLDSQFIGAEIESLNFADTFSKRLLRTASFSSQVALVTLNEAWEEAKLASVDPRRIGLIIGGSNIQQREIMQTYEKYKDCPHHIRPNYAISFLDSDLCGICTEHFKIKGFAYTVGGASASGQLAILKGIEALESGQVDICIVIGALMDLSYMEFQALRAIGAMGSDMYFDKPEIACRPFDKNHNGFIYGENCGAVIIEKKEHAMERDITPYATISGWAINMDGNRQPNPSFEGEVLAIKETLEKAGLRAEDIDYINPHGSGSILGDETELKAIKYCGLSHAYINSTKSITGHGLTAAGIVEFITTILQIKESQLHPTRNLENPIDESFNWIKNEPVYVDIKNALNLSIGFGGMNTVSCLKKWNTSVEGEKL
ncbi:beta-ketoacyl synthase N-terminal-like domain-containing protein [Clostridium estertheticum]|uniref:beta-ketoacyl synthase N-terminal-like domain-containing protein n=1 Tax=Clostridium estertheticum TaxID=238834 RepID=UPI001CF1BC6D|nr:beta-ketoacyl synthase N-terminal-like domain-containing protein [Clostridium estertheticum]MCB2360143.1 polyketide beta-ketoacyl:ACP synthase [Clostridium estertheticum]